jgi:hypothetical protein
MSAPKRQAVAAKSCYENMDEFHPKIFIGAKMKKYITSERSNLFEPNVYISVAVKITGLISAENAKKAIEFAYMANEATMSKIVLEENGDTYYEKVEASGCKIFFDNRDMKFIINESDKLPFAINKGELVRSYIISESQGITLLIHAHHLVGDGKSILILISDILDRLAGKALTYKPMTLIDKEYLIGKAKLPLGVKLFVKNINRKWEKTGRAFTWDDYYTIHKKYWGNHSSDFEIETYSADEMKKDCKNGVTLNSLLIAKMLKEFPESKIVGIPLSIREDNKSMSNQTSGISLKYRYNPQKSFEKNLTRIHKRIYKLLGDKNTKYFVLLFVAELCPSLIDSVLLQTHGCYQNKLSEKMANVMGYTSKNGPDLGVTNLTRIDIPGDFGNFKVSDMLFIPPKVSYSRQVIGVSTFGDKLTVCWHRMKIENPSKGL